MCEILKKSIYSIKKTDRKKCTRKIKDKIEEQRVTKKVGLSE